jgi:predicted pyridoxine 5'-phosphate oxidase superfamily flavin-nucleotide-binding protein
MADDYTAAQRALQDRFDTRRLADRLATGTSDRIGDAFKDFIEARDMFFIATVDEHGFPQCSYKGGPPGFVRVVDPGTIAFPVYDGNGMFLTAGNVAGGHPNVGLLFVKWEDGTRLRLNGEASIDHEDPLVDQLPHALFVVRVAVRAVFANCRRYVHQQELVERSAFTPAADGSPPVPDWKLNPWFEGSLPEGDPALDPARPSAPATPNYP